jgi:hypothetical protein
MYGLALVLLQEGVAEPEIAQHMGLGLLELLPLIILAGLVLVILPFCFICKKAGFSPWLSLLNLIPFGSLILLYVLAFVDWKVVSAPQAYWQQPPYPPQG